MNLPQSHRVTEKEEKEGKEDGKKIGVSLKLLALSPLRLCASVASRRKP